MTKYRRKKVLITGGLGFIGSNLALNLVSLGADIEIYDAKIPGMGSNDFNISPISKIISVTIADLRDESQVAKAVKRKDIIFNLAGTLSHVDSMKNPFMDLDINCHAQLVLLEACRKYNPNVKVIYAGTRNQYGKAKYLPVDENHPLDPTDINGVNSITGEKYHFMYQRVYGLRATSLRMTNTFGPRHQMSHSRQGVLNWFIRLIMEGKTVLLMRGGKQIRDINYIDDVVQAFLLAGISSKCDGQVYNLGGTPLSILEFTKKLIRIWGKGKYKKIIFPKDRKNIEVGDYIADYTKIKHELGWKPKTPIDSGIKTTFDYYSKYKSYYF